MKFISIVLSVLLFSSCTTLKDASDARGTGKSRIYSQSYDKVWATTINVIKESKLDLVFESKAEGRILAQKGMSAFSYGENVAVFVSSKSATSTEVEVVSKRALQTNVTAKDWGNDILNGIEAKLK